MTAELRVDFLNSVDGQPNPGCDRVTGQFQRVTFTFELTLYTVPLPCRQRDPNRVVGAPDSLYLRLELHQARAVLGARLIVENLERAEPGFGAGAPRRSDPHRGRGPYARARRAEEEVGYMKTLCGPSEEMSDVPKAALLPDPGLRARVPHQPAVAVGPEDIHHPTTAGHCRHISQIRSSQHGLALGGQPFDAQSPVDRLGTSEDVVRLVPVTRSAAHPEQSGILPAGMGQQDRRPGLGVCRERNVIVLAGRLPVVEAVGQQPQLPSDGSMADGTDAVDGESTFVGRQPRVERAGHGDVTQRGRDLAEQGGVRQPVVILLGRAVENVGTHRQLGPGP